ncbi:MAG: hypothetical protein PHZ26_03295 [Candidatus Gracilibacteria bacterium]|nr:hypothetical protein [Candidatus Gracilibacteria bacterium]MDD2908753.1 hypothetical protein [Candidatus Gracilibacteria bacterium]
MLKINSELFSKIKDKFASDKNTYAKIKLEESKIFFALMASMYFFFYLSTIAGYQIDIFSKLLSGIYPVFLFSIFILLYDIIVYGTRIYEKKVNTIKLPLIITFTIIYLILIAIFLGLKLN